LETTWPGLTSCLQNSPTNPWPGPPPSPSAAWTPRSAGGACPTARRWWCGRPRPPGVCSAVLMSPRTAGLGPTSAAERSPSPCKWIEPGPFWGLREVVDRARRTAGVTPAAPPPCRAPRPSSLASVMALSVLLRISARRLLQLVVAFHLAQQLGEPLPHLQQLAQRAHLLGHAGRLEVVDVLEVQLHGEFLVLPVNRSCTFRPARGSCLASTPLKVVAVDGDELALLDRPQRRLRLARQVGQDADDERQLDFLGRAEGFRRRRWICTRGMRTRSSLCC